MARGKKKESASTLEEKLAQALVADWEQPYKVPKNWCWVHLDAVLTEIKNGTTIKQDKSGDGYSVTRIESLQNQTIDFDRLGTIVDASAIKETDWYQEGDVALSHINSAEHVGKTALITSDMLPLVHGMNLLRLRFNEACLPMFYQYFSQSFQYKSEILDRINMAVNQVSINQKQLGSVEFPLPPVTEQQRIVDRIESLFAKLDEAKEKAQSVLDSFETRKAAILHKAFTGELTAKWRAEHGVERDSWNQGCLSNFCEVNPKKAATKDLPDNLEVSFVPMPALSDVLGEITDPQIRKLKEVRTGFTNFSEGDVVFAKITPCMENGKSAVVGPLVNNLGFGTTEFYVLRCSQMLFNRYLYHLVRSRTFRAEAKAVMTGAVGQQRVPKSFLEEYPLAIPSVPEQYEIVHILDSLFAKEQQAKEAAEAVLEKIDLLKKSILARAFRGELGTNDPSEERAVELLKRVLESDAPAETKKQSKSVPKELQEKLETELERKIIHLYFQRETESLPAEVLLSVSSKKFDVLEALHNLEHRGFIKKLNNGNYRLLG